MLELTPAAFAAALCDALDQGGGAGPLRLAAAPERLRHLPPGPSPYPGAAAGPHALVGVATALTASAFVRAGRPDEVAPLIDEVATLFARAHRRSAIIGVAGDLVGAFPSLWMPVIAAALARQACADAVTAILAFEGQTFSDPDGASPTDPAILPVLAHPVAAALGPFRFERAWVLARQEEVLAATTLDETLEQTRAFKQLFTENALALGEPDRALPLVEALEDGYVPVGDTRGGHLEFNGVCVLAASGRFEEALRRARALARFGYRTLFRFDLAAAATHGWTQRIRQNEYLARLAATPAYRAFLREDVDHEDFPVRDPRANTFAVVRDAVLGGTKRRRCWIDSTLIEPGEAVVRFRPRIGSASDGALEVAAKTRFDGSHWARVRRAFEADRVPIPAMFPKGRGVRPWRTPAINAFHHDVARDPAAFDLARAFALVADHAPRPIRRMWITGDRQDRPAFAPTVADTGHGEAVNLTWLLLKAGHAEALFAMAAASPQADKLFAMLATFDRPDCRAAAARHFDLPALGAAMNLAFSERPTLDTHLALAAFGRAHPRWRKGLVAAMGSYALHLFSNGRPGADWFLQGLEHYGGARCCQLLFFLVHHPEEDAVLATMLEHVWLPDGGGLGGGDHHTNARAFHYRAIVLHGLLDAPDRLDRWLATPWLKRYCDGAKDRETLRLVAAWRKRRLEPRRTPQA